MFSFLRNLFLYDTLLWCSLHNPKRFPRVLSPNRTSGTASVRYRIASKKDIQLNRSWWRYLCFRCRLCIFWIYFHRSNDRQVIIALSVLWAMALLVNAEDDQYELSRRRHRRPNRPCKSKTEEDKTYPIRYEYEDKTYPLRDEFEDSNYGDDGDDNRLFDNDCSHNGGSGPSSGILHTMFPGISNLFGGNRPNHGNSFRPGGLWGYGDFNPRRIMRQINRFLRPIYRLF